MASRIDYILSQLRGEQDPAIAPPMARPYSIAGRTFTPANPLTAVTSGYSWAQSQRDRPRLQKAMERELTRQEQAEVRALERSIRLEDAKIQREIEQQEVENELARLRAETAAGNLEVNRERAGYEAERIDLDKKDAEALAAHRKRQYALDLAQIEATKGEKERQAVEKEVANLSKAMEDLAPVESALQGVEEMVARYGDEDIPGAGFVEGAPGLLGKSLRAIQDVGSAAMGRPGRAQENFAQIEQLMATVRRNQIGSQQTRSELEKVLQQIGQSGWEEENVFREGVQAIRRHVESEKSNIYARASDSAVKLYETRIGRTQSGGSGLTPEEQAELEALEKEFGG